MLFKNAKLFIKENPFLSFLFFFTQVASVLILLFAYGIYMNMNYDLSKMEDDQKTYSFNTTGYIGGTQMPTSLLLDNCPEMFEEFHEFISSVGVRARVKTEIGIYESRADFSLEKVNGKLIYGLGEIDARYFQAYAKGDWFTADDYNNASKEVIIPYKLRSLGEDYQTFYGEKYKVKTYEEEAADEEEVEGMMKTMFFPVESIPKEAKIVSITLFLNRPISMGEYRKLCDKFTSVFGDYIEIPYYNRVEIKDTSAFKSMQYSAIGIALLASLTVGIILRYILLKRNKMTAIYRITGKTQLGVAVMYFIEMLIYAGASIALGIGIFMKILKGILVKNYEYFEIIFETNGYQEFVKIYAGIVLVVAMLIILLSNRKSPYEQLRALYK